MSCHAQSLLCHFTAQLGRLEGVAYSDMPWPCATFNGARHGLAFTVDPVAKVAAFARALPEADLPVPGGFVADALVTGIGGTRVCVAVLTIDAA